MALYAPVQQEVETNLIAEICLKKGISVCYPAIVDKKRPLSFYEIKGLGELKPARYGVLTPSVSKNSFPLNKFQVIFVPGLVFDQQGYRLGYGKGYYDRTLAVMEGLKVGLAYDFQVVKEVTKTPHDERVDMIISNRETFMIRKKND